MVLTIKQHQQIHCILLTINVVGLTLLFTAILVTYMNKTTVAPFPASQFPAPKIFKINSTNILNAPYVIKVRNDAKIACNGVVIKQKTALLSRRCFNSLFYDNFNGTLNLFLKSEAESDWKILNSSLNYDREFSSRNLIGLFLPDSFINTTSIALKSAQECLVGQNLTLLEYNEGIWTQRIVTTMDQADCLSAYPANYISDKEFCVVDKCKIVSKIFFYINFIIFYHNIDNEEPCQYLPSGFLFSSNNTEDALVGFYSYGSDNSQSHCTQIKAVFTNVGKLQRQMAKQ